MKTFACLLVCCSTIAFADVPDPALRPQYFDSLELSRKNYRQIELRRDGTSGSRRGVKIDEPIYGFNHAQVQEFENARILFAPMIPSALRQVKCTARVRFVIDKNGDPINPHVLSSSPKDFAPAALAMIERSKFPVIPIDGKPRYVRVDLPIVFAPTQSGPLAPIRYVYN